VEVQRAQRQSARRQSIVLEIRHLRGQLVATREKEPVTLDDVNSFVARIIRGEIAMSAPGNVDLMNRYVFAYHGAPLKKIDVVIDRGKIKTERRHAQGYRSAFRIEEP